MHQVIHVVTTIERGGAEKQLLILVDAQIKAGRPVTVIFLKGNPELKDSFISVGARVLDSLTGLNPILQVLFLNSILKKNGRTILHCHLPRAELIATFANLNLRYPILISRHNSERFFPQAPRIISCILSKFVTSRAIYVVAISKAVQNFLIQNHEISPNCPIKVVYYGYLRTNTLPRISSVGDQKVIGTIARLTPQKDIPTLLKGFKNLSKDGKYQLLVVGDGVLKEQLIKQASDLSIPNISWRGRVSDVSLELSRMDVFVLTSIYEGFGLVLLEAMDAGVPIVAARNSAIPEVLGESYQFLFETGNETDLTSKLEKILAADRAEIAEIGFKRLENFTIAKMLQNMDQIYALSEVSN